ncbi:MAG: gfo/Idh/MocA family oxidoreductase [Candidatus Hydrogenedentota bacterium]|jgi:predicted dehydrogenase|nr:Gfo/Idh/MocA family oxidoreductase [Candidatus Sumerlaea chitinivorans]RMH27819.1 MAG: gfo/Idh/MocA family oxidoreductase [Candidatus Hydrogenedentota bacterium]
MKPLEAVLVGAGQRGRDAFGAFALRFPHLLKFVAVADPDEGRRQLFAQQHNIPPERCFSSWQELLERPQFAPICANATMDREHLPSALAAMEAGYHLLLEKPMAHTAEGCMEIVETARRLRRIVQICHPLRYSPFYAKVKELLAAGEIGTLTALTMVENVGYWHFAHSYVRGNWARVDRSGPVILTKTCHDMDIAAWLVDAPARRVISIGELRYFRKEFAPEGAPERCTDGCPAEDSCPFYAPAAYLGANTDWPVSAISPVDRSYEARKRALETGPYGRCVFRADNDALDHQMVLVEFANGVLFNFTVSGCTSECFRTIRALGTKGELDGHAEKREIRVDRFAQGVWPALPRHFYHTQAMYDAHGGGDTGVMKNLVRLVRSDDFAGAMQSLEIALEGHLLSFAAERARLDGVPLDMETYRQRIRASLGAAAQA